MKITYDKSIDALYVYILEISLLKTFKIVKKTEGDWPIHFDFTKDNQLFGIEILESKRYFSKQTLDKIITKDNTAIIAIINDLKSFKSEDNTEKESVNNVIKFLTNRNS